MVDKSRSLLIIDPDPKERQKLTAFFRKENFYVESGKGLPDAIKKLSEGCFKCLIMDVNLPEMKGYEAISILKNINPHIKIIMMTNRNSKRLEAKVRGQDIFFYFIKSFGKDELKMAINNAFVK